MAHVNFTVILNVIIYMLWGTYLHQGINERLLIHLFVKKMQKCYVLL